ncbi:probable inactive receptor kinase At2g26730 [Andrographis paniculata]|uniref:probable inactive receptor kinase At2g26730 n=1 Tax=Andrographis paniculata TaxID=175694 RepID=UPI0021E753E0|nr:probable inactive receptor kinase At2g26730 [Andrographis paniculata]
MPASMILTAVLLLAASVAATGESPEVRDALVQFMAKLSPGDNRIRGVNWGWNSSSDPCFNAWTGVTCYSDSKTVKKIVLEGLNLTGKIDAASLCVAKGLVVFSVNENDIAGGLPEEMSNCSRLTHIYLHRNRLSGSLPGSLSRMGNLKRIVVSDNDFSGDIPNIARISGLLSFLAENNRLTGGVPSVDFSNMEEFNVSNNNLIGRIPDDVGSFNESSFSGNLGLCGVPLSNICPPSPPPPKGKSRSKDYFIYSGYALIGLIIVVLIIVKLIKNRKASGNKVGAKDGVHTDRSRDKMSTTSSGSKGNRSEFSITSTEESVRGSNSLIVLSTPVFGNGLKFEELLQSPAELLGRNRHGTLYKVMLNDRVPLVVKRRRDWDISKDDFKTRIEKIDRVRHPNVLPVIAFYCSRHEKLVIYEFQENSSLAKLLQGSHNGESFDWGSRLNIAAKISTALAFMHDGLKDAGIAHGNLKSSNILFSSTMEPLISEYGLAEAECHDQSILDNNPFRKDVLNFGILVLELLTGKVVESNGIELARSVKSAIMEEWTVEVFDKVLVPGGASEERMLNLLQVGLTCVNGSLKMREVATMISSIKEHEEQSSSFTS